MPVPQWWTTTEQSTYVQNILDEWKTALGAANTYINTGGAGAVPSLENVVLSHFIARYVKYCTNPERAVVNPGGSVEHDVVFVCHDGKLTPVEVKRADDGSVEAATRKIQDAYAKLHPGKFLHLKPAMPYKLPVRRFVHTFVVRGRVTDNSAGLFDADRAEPLVTVVKYTTAKTAVPSGGRPPSSTREVVVVPQGALSTEFGESVDFKRGAGTIGKLTVPCGADWVPVDVIGDLRRMCTLTTAENPVVHFATGDNWMNDDKNPPAYPSIFCGGQVPVAVDIFTPDDLFSRTGGPLAAEGIDMDELQLARSRANASHRPKVEMVSIGDRKRVVVSVCCDNFSTLSGEDASEVITELYDAVGKWARGSPVKLQFPKQANVEGDILSAANTMYPLVYGVCTTAMDTNAGFTNVFIDPSTKHVMGTYDADAPTLNVTEIDTMWATTLKSDVAQYYEDDAGIEPKLKTTLATNELIVRAEAALAWSRMGGGQTATVLVDDMADRRPLSAATPTAGTAAGTAAVPALAPAIDLGDAALASHFEVTVGDEIRYVAFEPRAPSQHAAYVTAETGGPQSHMWARIEARLKTLPSPPPLCNANTYHELCDLLIGHALIDAVATDLQFAVEFTQTNPDVPQPVSRTVATDNEFQAARQEATANATCTFKLAEWKCKVCSMSHPGAQKKCRNCDVRVTVVSNDREETPEAVELVVNSAEGNITGDRLGILKRLEQPLPTKARFHLSGGAPMDGIKSKTREHLGIAVTNLTLYTRNMDLLNDDGDVAEYFTTCRAVGDTPHVLAHAPGWQCERCYKRYCNSKLNKQYERDGTEVSSGRALHGPDAVNSAHAYRWTHSPYASVCPLKDYSDSDRYISVQANPSAGRTPRSPQQWSASIADKPTRTDAEQFASHLVSMSPSGTTNWMLHQTFVAETEADLRAITVPSLIPTPTIYATPLLENSVYTHYSTEVKDGALRLNSRAWIKPTTTQDFHFLVMELSTKPVEAPECPIEIKARNLSAKTTRGTAKTQLTHGPADRRSRCYTAEVTAARNATIVVVPVYRYNLSQKNVDTFRMLLNVHEGIQDWDTWEGILAIDAVHSRAKTGAFNGLYKFDVEKAVAALKMPHGQLTRPELGTGDGTAGVYTLRSGDTLKLPFIMDHRRRPKVAEQLARLNGSTLITGNLSLSMCRPEAQYMTELENWHIVGKELDKCDLKDSESLVASYHLARPLKPCLALEASGGKIGMLNQLYLDICANGQKGYKEAVAKEKRIPTEHPSKQNVPLDCYMCKTHYNRYTVDDVYTHFDKSINREEIALTELNQLDPLTNANVYSHATGFYAKLKKSSVVMPLYAYTTPQQRVLRSGAIQRQLCVKLIKGQAAPADMACWHQSNATSKWAFGRTSELEGQDYVPYGWPDAIPSQSIALKLIAEEHFYDSTLCYTANYVRKCIQKAVRGNDVVTVEEVSSLLISETSVYEVGRCRLNLDLETMSNFNANPNLRIILDATKSGCLESHDSRLAVRLGIRFADMHDISMLVSGNKDDARTLAFAHVSYTRMDPRFATPTDLVHEYSDFLLPGAETPFKSDYSREYHNWSPRDNLWNVDFWNVWKRVHGGDTAVGPRVCGLIKQQLTDPFYHCAGSGDGKTEYMPPDPSDDRDIAFLESIGSLHTLLRRQPITDLEEQVASVQDLLSAYMIKIPGSQEDLRAAFDEHDANNDPMIVPIDSTHHPTDLYDVYSDPIELEIFRRIPVMEHRLWGLATTLFIESPPPYSVSNSNNISFNAKADDDRVVIKWNYTPRGTASLPPPPTLTIAAAIKFANNVIGESPPDDATQEQTDRSAERGTADAVPLLTTIILFNGQVQHLDIGDNGAKKLIADLKVTTVDELSNHKGDIMTLLALASDDDKNQPWYNYVCALNTNGLLVSWYDNDTWGPAVVSVPKYDTTKWEDHHILTFTHTLQPDPDSLPQVASYPPSRSSVHVQNTELDTDTAADARGGEEYVTAMDRAAARRRADTRPDPLQNNGPSNEVAPRKQHRHIPVDEGSFLDDDSNLYHRIPYNDEYRLASASRPQPTPEELVARPRTNVFSAPAFSRGDYSSGQYR